MAKKCAVVLISVMLLLISCACQPTKVIEPENIPFPPFDNDFKGGADLAWKDSDSLYVGLIYSDLGKYELWLIDIPAGKCTLAGTFYQKEMQEKGFDDFLRLNGGLQVMKDGRVCLGNPSQNPDSDQFLFPVYCPETGEVERIGAGKPKGVSGNAFLNNTGTHILYDLNYYTPDAFLGYEAYLYDISGGTATFITDQPVFGFSQSRQYFATAPTVKSQSVSQLPGGYHRGLNIFDIECNLFYEYQNDAYSTMDLPHWNGADQLFFDVLAIVESVEPGRRGVVLDVKTLAEKHVDVYFDPYGSPTPDGRYFVTGRIEEEAALGRGKLVDLTAGRQTDIEYDRFFVTVSAVSPDGKTFAARLHLAGENRLAIISIGGKGAAPFGAGFDE